MQTRRARAHWPTWPTAILIAAAVVGTTTLSSTPAQAGICSPQDIPDDEVRLVPLFSEFRENYFITGWPLGSTTSNPRDYVKFQFSIKFNLIPTPSRCTVFFTFTQKSFWKLWTKSPAFEDSNYNPAFWFAWRNHDLNSRIPGALQGFHRLGFFLGYEHESNGLASPDSRAWDRVSAFARLGYFFRTSSDLSAWSLVVEPKAWYPKFPADVPAAMSDYLGYGQISLALERNAVNPDFFENPKSPRYIYRDLSLGVLYRPGKRFDRPYIEASARLRPINRPEISWAVFAQFSTGYGETFARYDQNEPPTFRIGIALDERVSTPPKPGAPITSAQVTAGDDQPRP